MTLETITRCFTESGREIATVESENGCYGVIPDGARILALAFTPSDETLFFVHPAIERIRTSGVKPTDLPGGPGGDRLRFAPEYAYAWVGEERDLRDFSNYRVQTNEEPGVYTLTRRGPDVVLFAETSLIDGRSNEEIPFTVERVVRPTASPVDTLPSGCRYAGYEISQRLSIQSHGGSVGLWSLLQVPTSSHLIVPLRRPDPPREYFNTGRWRQDSDCLYWLFGGEANAKIGYGSESITGRTGTLRQTGDGAWSLLVRDFPVRKEMYYCDGLSEKESGDQVFQAWDGFGFGEMEYHSPAVGSPPLPEMVEDTSYLWAFEGPWKPLSELIRILLEINPPDDFRRTP